MSGTGTTSDPGTTPREPLSCPVWTQPCIGCAEPGCRIYEDYGLEFYDVWSEYPNNLPSTLEALTNEVYPNGE